MKPVHPVSLFLHTEPALLNIIKKIENSQIYDITNIKQLILSVFHCFSSISFFDYLRMFYIMNIKKNKTAILGKGRDRMKPTELPCEERLLDLEWILLMKDAREIGLEPEDVKAFLEQCNGNQEGR